VKFIIIAMPDEYLSMRRNGQLRAIRNSLDCLPWFGSITLAYGTQSCLPYSGV